MLSLLTSVPAASKLHQLQVTWRSFLAAPLGFENFFPDRGKLGRARVALPYSQEQSAYTVFTLPVGASPTQCLSISNVCSRDRIPSCLRSEAVRAGFFLRVS